MQRWLKFVKYLRHFGVEPVVYAPENPSYPIIDKSFESEIPDGVKVIKKKIFEPYSIAGLFSKKETETISSGIISKEENQSAMQKAMLYIRGNFFIPDARNFWVKPSVSFLREELKNGDYDAIITTGPPHSLHLIGLKLKEELGINWVADFRDPWTRIGYHEKLKLTDSSRKKHEELEKSVLNTADHIITTSFTTRDEFISKTSKPVTVITNGFDAEISREEPENDKFELAHIGSLLSERNPVELWKAIGELIQENMEFANNFRLRLAGKISEEVLDIISENAIQPYLENEGYVSHAKALELQRSASVLLLIEIDSEETKGIIPGKLFEYLAAKRPILAIGPENWDVERIITRTGAGEMYNYADINGIKSYILRQFQKYQQKDLLSNSHNIADYHRKTLTEKLANLIKNL